MTNEHHTPGCGRTLARACAALLVAAALPLGIRVAGAAPVSVAGGYDYYADNQDQTTRAAVAVGAVSFLGADVFAAGMRYDNNVIGRGDGFAVGGGLPVAPLVQLRASGTRFIGDGDYRAWRIKAGPLLKLPTGQTLGLYYTRDEDGISPVTNGVLAEGATRLTAQLSARATLGYAQSADAARSMLGTLGATWSPMRLVELSGEVGMTQNVLVGTGQAVPRSRRGLDGLPILGGSTGSDVPLSAVTTLLSVRVKFP